MKKIFGALFITAALMAGCGDDTKNPTPEPSLTGGKGGASTLKVTPQHHGENIDSCTIFIKYAAKDKPSSYDDSAVCVLIGGKPVATFDSLLQGDYYLFGHGYDTSIFEIVEGGAPVKIDGDGIKNVNLPVTEGD